MALTDHKATLTGASEAILAGWTKFNALIDDLLIPPIDDFTNAAHDHGDTANGGNVVTQSAMGSFSRGMAEASGNQSVTGVGFAPSSVIFLAGLQNTIRMSIGMDDATTTQSIGYLQNTSGPYNALWQISVAASIQLYVTASVYYVGYLGSLDADGFTVAWTKVGSPTGTATIFYMAFR